MKNQRMSSRHRSDGRLILGFAGLLFVPLTTAGGCFLFFAAPRPQAVWEWVFRIVLDELAVTAMFFFSLGFLWAMSGNRRLKRTLDAVATKFASILIGFLILAFVVAACIVIIA
jgi:hypothetical protein